MGNSDKWLENVWDWMENNTVFHGVLVIFFDGLVGSSRSPDINVVKDHSNVL